MISFALFCYLIKFLILVKAQNHISKPKINCESPRKYYNSINYQCEDCTTRDVFNNICYSQQPESIYRYTFSEVSDQSCNSNNGEYLTELDEDGFYLGSLNCASSRIKDNSSKDYGRTISISINILENIKGSPQRLNKKKATFRIDDENEIGYAFDSCEKGIYEKSCQFLINLCALNMYKDDEDNTDINYCTIINRLGEENENYR